jgi:hypothetical protein
MHARHRNAQLKGQLGNFVSIILHPILDLLIKEVRKSTHGFLPVFTSRSESTDLNLSIPFH